MAVADQDRGGRIAAIDVARGVALVAMIVYHLAFDLRARGMIAADVVGGFGWVLLARLTAGTFLALVGINLVMATRRGFKPRRFLRRLGLIAGGALLVTAATWWFDANTFVFFGILHGISVCSVLALPFLWLPTPAVALAAAAALAAPHFLASPIFNTPALWWIGLSTVPPTSVDFVPVLPWFGVVLGGVVAGRLFATRFQESALAGWLPTGGAVRFTALAGQWSLPIYLLHQPILVGALALAAPFVPPNETVARQNLMSDCAAACAANRGGVRDCAIFCGCVSDNVSGADLITVTTARAMSPDLRQRWDTIVERCGDAATMPPPPR